jgi:hypothetical protein
MARNRPQVSDAQREARRIADRERMEQAARELLSSEGWRRWVRVRARNGLGRYSMGNQLLIALQRPDATFVAGFRAFLELDRCVRRGERGLRILAPIGARATTSTAAGGAGRAATADHAAARRGDDDDARARIRFRSIAVFDVSQTEPLPGGQPVALAAPSQPISGDSHRELIGPLVRHAARLGYRVRFEAVAGSAGGWCDPRSRTIVVDAGLPANAQLRVLVHELAHAHGIGYRELGRRRAEVLVDTVTFIVCGSIGLDVSGESVPYVAGWGEDGELDAIRQNARTIDEVARRLEDALAADSGQEQAA